MLIGMVSKDKGKASKKKSKPIKKKAGKKKASVKSARRVARRPAAAAKKKVAATRPKPKPAPSVTEEPQVASSYVPEQQTGMSETQHDSNSSGSPREISSEQSNQSSM